MWKTSYRFSTLQRQGIKHTVCTTSLTFFSLLRPRNKWIRYLTLRHHYFQSHPAKVHLDLSIFYLFLILWVFLFRLLFHGFFLGLLFLWFGLFPFLFVFLPYFVTTRLWWTLLTNTGWVTTKLNFLTKKHSHFLPPPPLVPIVESVLLYNKNSATKAVNVLLLPTNEMLNGHNFTPPPLHVIKFLW